LPPEALEAMAAEHDIEITAAESRRNVLTRGIDLNALVGRRFRIGEVECLGVELCHPCKHLESVTQPA
jgi:MOSC domain-containing protein YiiM